ncbi:unnamed protein product [Rotaria sp. Silwood2]|nr:unnamed protein product [Rotaria sp. Silwood2]CAF2847890.1 unnamed protein product [Rotaria sp. Silwood2]CAF3249518.1 unnamed protein product [Rotaria sp. Silwood2]CAF4064321.1 unnamed protein product [Rotaria sp. Silwood2]CAF4077154.1 unnamed protein product [Rotaria sp. Silwood2]
MYILGIELAASFDSYDHVVDPSASAPLSLPKPLSPDLSYRTISLSKLAASFASHSGGTYMQSSTASMPKPSVSKLELQKCFNYFDKRSATIESSSKVSSFNGKHGDMPVPINEPRSSNDDTMNEMLSIDSTYFFPNETVRCDEIPNKIYVSMDKRDQCQKVRTLTCNFLFENRPTF